MNFLFPPGEYFGKYIPLKGYCKIYTPAVWRNLKAEDREESDWGERI